MADLQQAELGDVQMTLFVPLAARARETRHKRPALRDPKAVEMIESIGFDESLYGRGWGGFVTVLRTLIFDWWVRQFLAAHPAGTVVEVGAGLNSRFERRRAVQRRDDRVRHLHPGDARTAAQDGGPAGHGGALGVGMRRPANARAARPAADGVGQDHLAATRAAA
jgi:hypothetical protein